ncbi:MAG: gamma-glutamyltransferase [candidate division Zixibacteria bacterium]|nr:gamma-glutamyltransferase [candidate division Zixibacteria bacterium]MDH3938120.1 gamma-glutamyltransferase [candidate division Zixibacteria bacterium]MDH4033510.1 gamma-glutamyltransferase [candidate division Zixibacteria bacterium]
MSKYGMVSTQHYLATEAGVQMLAENGNAVDAAVAAALALCVCEPAACGLGGQTALIVHRAKTKKTFVFDGSSFAPHRAIPGSIPKEERRRGYKAATVPTTPRVLAYALDRYGTLPWPRVIEPAIKLAEDGFEVSALLNALTRRELKFLRQGTASRHFLKKGRDPYRVGERFKQPALADCLKRLARRGVDDFYTGKIARAIHRDMVNNKGLIRRDDLAQVQPPIERRPVACWWEGKRVMTMPPPGAGRTLIEMLNIVSQLPKKMLRLDTPRSVLAVARVMRQAYRDRRDRPYDPNYYAQVSDHKMLSPDYGKRIAKRIRTAGETTHLSVMDRFGNAVSLTQSIERVFGSCCAAEDLGFLYNNYLMAFDHEDMSHPYHLRPAAVPWASVAPTIVFQGRVPWLVIGSPGSERITASILQVLLRLRNQSPLEAVNAPRLYCSIGGKISLEASRMRSDIPEYLEDHGFEIDIRDPYSFYMGCVQLILREGSDYIGVADPRRDGAAGGPRP